jgi:hypothetical protein
LELAPATSVGYGDFLLESTHNQLSFLAYALFPTFSTLSYFRIKAIVEVICTRTEESQGISE